MIGLTGADVEFVATAASLLACVLAAAWCGLRAVRALREAPKPPPRPRVVELVPTPPSSSSEPERPQRPSQVLRKVVADRLAEPLVTIVPEVLPREQLVTAYAARCLAPGCDMRWRPLYVRAPKRLRCPKCRGYDTDARAVYRVLVHASRKQVGE